MTKLLTASDICERYGCSEKTARRYMRQMVHMEMPLRVTETALLAWEASRTYESSSKREVARKGLRSPNKGIYHISRTRPGRTGT